MKLVILGGGGVRSLMLAKSLAGQAKALGIDEIVLMDSQEDKLRIFGAMAGEILDRLQSGVQWSLTTDTKEAVTNADFVITTIRVGGDKSRAVDERIAISHGVIGQETTGAGGFFMASRSIPVLSRYCSLIKAHARPDVMVFNFTNPAGLVTQAMHDMGYPFVYGICDAPSGFLRQVAAMVGGDINAMSMDVFGLNHLSYFSNIMLKGEDITKKVLEDQRLYRQTDMKFLGEEPAKRMGLLLNEYLYYYYFREKAEANLKRAEKTRGERIAEINAGMMAELQGLDPHKDFDKMLDIYAAFAYQREESYMSTETGTERAEVPRFDIESPDDGGYAGVALGFIKAKQMGVRSEMVLCVPNKGLVDWLEPTDIIETSCYIGPDGAIPKPLAVHLPDTAVNLVRTVKLYERKAAQAIIHKNSQLAVEALMVHPLVNSYSLAVSLFDAFVSAYGDWH